MHFKEKNLFWNPINLISTQLIIISLLKKRAKILHASTWTSHSYATLNASRLALLASPSSSTRHDFLCRISESNTLKVGHFLVLALQLGWQPHDTSQQPTFKPLHSHSPFVPLYIHITFHIGTYPHWSPRMCAATTLPRHSTQSLVSLWPLDLFSPIRTTLSILPIPLHISSPYTTVRIYPSLLPICTYLYFEW